MNSRILRIELRRSIAPWAALAAVVVALGFLYSFSGPWTRPLLAWYEHWGLAALWTRFLLVFLWPIAIGAGVIQGMRDSRSGMSELLTTMPRPGWHRAAKLAAALAGLLVLGYLLVFAVGAVQVIFNGGFFTLSWLPIVVVGVLSMIAGAWIGLGVGRLLPHPLTAPVMAVGTFAAVVVLQGVPAEGNTFEGVLPLRAALLSPAMDVFYDPFLITAGRVDLGQAVWLIGLAVTGFLLLAAGSRKVKALAAVPVLAALAVAVPVLPATPAEARVADPLAIAEVCDGSVCVTKMHETELARFAGPGKQALRLLGTLPGAPTKVAEFDRRLQPGDVPPRAADTVFAELMEWPLRWSADPDDMTRILLAGAGTPSCYSTRETDRLYLDEFTARTIAASWFLGEWKPTESNTHWISKETAVQISRKWETFRALPPDEQRTRIIALRQAGLTCQGNQLDILLGGAVR